MGNGRLRRPEVVMREWALGCPHDDKPWKCRECTYNAIREIVEPFAVAAESIGTLVETERNSQRKITKEIIAQANLARLLIHEYFANTPNASTRKKNGKQ